jgi:hypothetical protein
LRFFARAFKIRERASAEMSTHAVLPAADISFFLSPPALPPSAAGLPLSL